MGAPKLIVRDAFGFLEENPGQFDVVISDTTDPIGMAERLFSDEFYKRMVRALTPGGAASTQCEQPFFDTALIQKIYASAKSLTKNPAYYYAHIPTYPGGGIGFMYVSYAVDLGIEVVVHAWRISRLQSVRPRRIGHIHKTDPAARVGWDVRIIVCRIFGE